MADGSRQGLLEVLFPSERDVERWQERHLAGEVPGRWPYGLDRLGRVTSLDVRTCSVPPPGPGRRALARAVPDRLVASIGSRRSRSGRDIGLAWDENAGQRMLTLRPHREMYAGAIWVTDALRRAGSPAARKRIAAVHRTLGRMAGVFVLSKAQIDPLVEFLGPDGPRVGFVRFGVDADFYRLAAFPERPLVVSVGGDRDRDSETLFAALEGVRRAVPEAEIVVQTTSALRPPTGVTKVRYFTHLQLRDLYARASVVAIATQPNLHASGMTVSLEAMATGRPVVITATPGLEDYVDDGVTGHLVPTSSADAMRDRVVDLLLDRDRAERLGSAGRALVESSFTSDHLVSDLAGFMDLPALTHQAAS